MTFYNFSHHYFPQQTEVLYHQTHWNPIVRHPWRNHTVGDPIGTKTYEYPRLDLSNSTRNKYEPFKLYPDYWKY